MTATSRIGYGRRCAALACGLVGALALVALLGGDPAGSRRIRSDPGAVGLLRAAADAARGVPYQGRRFLTTWSRAGTATSRVSVSHRPGEGVRYRSETGGGYRPPAQTGATSGFTPRTLALLTRNYSVVRAADATMCGRRARVVEAHRPDGTLAGRFWLDEETGLMLRRELVDATGKPVITTGFSEISFTAPATVSAPLGTPRGGPSRLSGAGAGRPAERDAVSGAESTWGERLDETAVEALRDAGWPIPADLPGRLTLHEVRRERGGGTVHLGYSDGLAAVSVFVQRGVLDDGVLAGWERTVHRGRTVFHRESLHRWAVTARNGYVHTVLTDAPQSTAVAVAAHMPRGSDPFWARLARGARSLVSAIDPTG